MKGRTTVKRQNDSLERQNDSPNVNSTQKTFTERLDSNDPQENFKVVTPVDTAKSQQLPLIPISLAGKQTVNAQRNIFDVYMYDVTLHILSVSFSCTIM